MKYPHFNIGVASDIVGIAPETIRHYERKNILKPSVQDSNRYRLYTMPDICVLGRARAYREFGFSLEESHAIMSHHDIGFTVESFQSRASELEEKIFKELAVLGFLKKKIENIEKVRDNLGKFSMCNRPPMAGVHTFSNGTPDVASIKAAKVSEWYSNQIVTFPYWSFDGKRFEELDVEDFEIYMGVLESDLSTSDFMPEEGVVRHPARTCLYTATFSGIDEDRKKTFAPVVDYLHRHRMHVNGEVVWQTVIGHQCGESFKYYRNLWIPII